MKRNCSLELRLLPPSDSLSSTDFGSVHHHHHKQLTIFYGGRVCVCDVTELQARAILMIANRETEEKMRSPSSSSSSRGGSPSPPVSPRMECHLYIPGPPTSGLSMKRSLQRFLQKRKHRVSPY